MNDQNFLNLLRRAYPGRVSCTPKEAIVATGVSNSTLHRKLQDGALPSVEVSVGEKGRINRVIDLSEGDAA